MKTKVNYLRKYNDTNTYSQTINVICSEKEFMDMAQVVKSYIKSGNTYKVIATIKLHDECKNGMCSWSITGILYQKKGNGRFYNIGYSCLLEGILKASPKLKMFVDLHSCDWHGVPLYPVGNGYYLLKKE